MSLKDFILLMIDGLKLKFLLRFIRQITVPASVSVVSANSSSVINFWLVVQASDDSWERNLKDAKILDEDFNLNFSSPLESILTATGFFSAWRSMPPTE